MKIIPFPEKLATEYTMCVICGKRKATKLCDFPIAHQRWVGHPPISLMEKAKNSDNAFCKVEMEWTNTCNRPVCDECSVNFGSVDICLDCSKKLRAAEAEKKGRKT